MWRTGRLTTCCDVESLPAFFPCCWTSKTVPDKADASKDLTERLISRYWAGWQALTLDQYYWPSTCSTSPATLLNGIATRQTGEMFSCCTNEYCKTHKADLLQHQQSHWQLQLVHHPESSFWDSSIWCHFFCSRSGVLRPSAHMLPGIGWCGAGLLPFPTACWWLTHPAAIPGVSVSASQSWRMGWTVCFASLQSQSAESMMPICFRCARRPQCPVRNLNIVVCSVSCQMVDWVCRGVVVSSGSFPLTFVFGVTALVA